jgi:hypothetical protein
MATIPLSECKHRGFYRVHSRNLSLAVFDVHRRGFHGVRTKFYSRYIDLEISHDDGGTCRALELLPDELPETVTLTIEESYSSCTGCERRVTSHVDAQGLYHWTHDDDGSDICKAKYAMRHDPDRTRLFKWLRTMEAKYEAKDEERRVQMEKEDKEEEEAK